MTGHPILQPPLAPKDWYPKWVRHLGRGYATVVLAALKVVGLCYVLCAIWPPHMEDLPEPAAHNPAPEPLDWYILRDASGSVRADQYDDLEAAIRGRFCPRSGDRVVRAYFGSLPQSLSAPLNIYPPVPGVAPSGIRNETNFIALFEAVLKAIKSERNATLLTGHTHHADAVVIISDGIPALISQRPLGPPGSSRFIHDDIVRALNKLVDGASYCSGGPVKVRLVILGVRGGNDALIKQSWDNSVLRPGSPASMPGRFVSYAGELKQSESLLFNSLARTPQESVVLVPLSDEERHRMDEAKAFSVQFEAKSFIKGASFYIDRGTLKNARTSASISLDAMKDPNFGRPTPGDQSNRMSIEIHDPEPGSLVGKPQVGSISLSPGCLRDAFGRCTSGVAMISSKEVYDLQLVAESPGGSYVEVPTLRLGRSYEAQSLGEIRTRSVQAVFLLVTLMFAYVAATLFWAVTSRAASGIWKRIHHILTVYTIHKYSTWLWASFGVAVIALAGLWRIGYKVVVYVAGGGLFAAAAFLHHLEGKHSSSLVVRISGIAIETVVPVVIHLVSSD